jgi:hypothetical protein
MPGHRDYPWPDHDNQDMAKVVPGCAVEAYAQAEDGRRCTEMYSDQTVLRTACASISRSWGLVKSSRLRGTGCGTGTGATITGLAAGT